MLWEDMPRDHSVDEYYPLGTSYILPTCLYKSMMIIITDQQKAKEIRQADMVSHTA